MTRKITESTAVGILFLGMACGSCFAPIKAAAEEMKAYKAHEITPYKASEITPYQAKEIKPHQSEGIKEYRAKEIEPVRSKTVEQVQVKPVVPVQAQQIAPYQADAVKQDKAKEVDPSSARGGVEVVRPLTPEQTKNKPNDAANSKGKKGKQQTKETTGDRRAKGATPRGGNPYGDPYSITNYNTGQPQSVFTVPGMVH